MLTFPMHIDTWGIAMRKTATVLAITALLAPKTDEEQDPSTFLAPIDDPGDTMKSFLNPNAAPEVDGPVDEADAG